MTSFSILATRPSWSGGVFVVAVIVGFWPASWLCTFLPNFSVNSPLFSGSTVSLQRESTIQYHFHNLTEFHSWLVWQFLCGSTFMWQFCCGSAIRPSMSNESSRHVGCFHVIWHTLFLWHTLFFLRVLCLCSLNELRWMVIVYWVVFERAAIG